MARWDPERRVGETEQATLFSLPAPKLPDQGSRTVYYYIQGGDGYRGSEIHL